MMTRRMVMDYKDNQSMDLADEIYSIKDTNIMLKKQLNDERERSKILMIKVQKLSEDVKKSKELLLPNKGLSARELAKKRDIETEEMIKDLKKRVQELTKANNKLNSKVITLQTIQDAQKRKRNKTNYNYRYSTINSKNNYSNTKRLVPTVLIGNKQHNKGVMRDAMSDETESIISESSVEEYPKKEMISVYTETEEKEFYDEEKEKLQTLTNTYRNKIEKLELELEKEKGDKARIIEDHESELLKEDIERISMQKDISDKNKKILEIKRKNEELSGKYESINEAFEEATKEIENINKNYKEERKKRVEAEEKIKNLKVQEKNCTELETIINDLRIEKEHLANDLDKLVSDNLNGNERLNKKHDEEIQQYIKNEEKLNLKINEIMEEKASLLKEIEKLNKTLKDNQTDLSILNSSKLEMQQKYEELKEKIDSILKDGIEWKDIEESLTIVNLRKKNGITKENLLNVENSIEDKKLLQDLQIQYADCVRDLEKYQKLLEIEEKINNEFKLENEDLKKKIEQIKNEYEMRLEEDSRILDLRSNKIAYLEAQLKNIIYGTTKIPQKIKEEKENINIQNVELENGQNLIEFNIKCANINSEGINILSDLGFNDNNESMTTCISYDFYEFESQSTPLGLGVNPRFNSISKYKVFVDDFFLYHIQNKTMILEMYRTNGVEYVNFATCNVSFKDLLDPSLTSNNECLKYYNDLISISDNKTIVGNIEYTIKAFIPMNQAIKAYKDRSVALNLLSNTSSSAIEPPVSVNTRQQYNELTIEIVECKGIVSKDNEKYKNPFVAYKFYIYDEVITDTVWNNLSPKFNNVNKIMLAMTPSLDRYLRTSSLSIAVFNDDKTEDNYIFGAANVSLNELANNKSIHGIYDIMDDNQNKVGKISVNISWDKDYTVEPIPLISKYDEYIVKSETTIKPKNENKKEKISNTKNKKNSSFSKSNSMSSLKKPSSNISNSKDMKKSSTKSSISKESSSFSSSDSKSSSSKSKDKIKNSSSNKSLLEQKENSIKNLTLQSSNDIKKMENNDKISFKSKSSEKTSSKVSMMDDNEDKNELQNQKLVILKTEDIERNSYDESDKSSVISLDSSKSNKSKSGTSIKSSKSSKSTKSSKSSKSNHSNKSNKSSISSKSHKSSNSDKSHKSSKSDKSHKSSNSDKSHKSSKSDKSHKSSKSDKSHKSDKSNANSLEKQSSKEKVKTSLNNSLNIKNNDNDQLRAFDNNEKEDNSNKNDSLDKKNSNKSLENMKSQNLNNISETELMKSNSNISEESKNQLSLPKTEEIDKEELKPEIIPITLNKENDEFEIGNNDNSLKNVKEIDEDESDIMSYTSDEDEKNSKISEKNKKESVNQTFNEIKIPKINIITTNINNNDNVDDKIVTPSPHDSLTDDEIEENIEKEYLTDDFEDEDVEIIKNDNEEEIDKKIKDDNNSDNSDQNNDMIEIVIESASFKSDSKVQELLKDVKQCFIAYEFLNYEPQDLTSDYSMLSNNKMIFHFSKKFNINESPERLEMFKNMLNENDFQISIFKPPDESGISNELAFAEWDWKFIIDNDQNIQYQDITLFDPNQTIEMGTMTISFKGINIIRAV